MVSSSVLRRESIVLTFFCPSGLQVQSSASERFADAEKRAAELERELVDARAALKKESMLHRYRGFFHILSASTINSRRVFCRHYVRAAENDKREADATLAALRAENATLSSALSNLQLEMHSLRSRQ